MRRNYPRKELSLNIYTKRKENFWFRLGRVKHWVLAGILAAALLLPACAAPREAGVPENNEQLMVVASIFPLTDMVRQVGGRCVQAATLIPPGASPHAYEPTAAEAKKLAGADLVIIVGQGLDQSAQNLAAGYEAPVMTITEGLKMLPLPETLGGEEEPAGETHDHDHGLYDPHVWLDPILVRDTIAPQITTKLQELDPENYAYYQQRLEEFQQELTRLDAEIRQQVATWASKKFITFHAGWHYFTHRYGLEDINVEEFPNEEPSARQLEQIITLARDVGTRAIFTEPQFSPKTAQVIAAELDAKVLILDPLGGDGIPERDSYLALMRWNLSQLTEGLK